MVTEAVRGSTWSTSEQKLVKVTSYPSLDAIQLPNSLPAIRDRARKGEVVGWRVWAMLPMRIVLAVAFQALIAFGYLLTGDETPWQSAADYWIASFAVAEFVNLWLLARLARLEGIRFVDLFNPRSAGRSTDIKWTSLAIVVAAPLALVPTVLLAQALWSDPGAGQEMLFHPVSVPAAWAMLFVFPVIHALTELPTYYGYVLPRLQALTSRVSLPLVLTASTLSLQHAVLPLLLDTTYLVWRALMFLPLAIWFGWVIQRRPTTLPYMAVAHGLLDISLPIFVLTASITG
jgi:hypothetical protein